ncbi:hypothetical protein SCLCIDRAFT_128541, partial [Scleroderma citrinum Foug A]
LSYLASCEVILFEWPSAIHKAPINDFVQQVKDELIALPYPTTLIHIQFDQNRSISTLDLDSNFVPDAVLSFLMKVQPCLHKYQAILEVVFSQHWENVIQKVKDIIAEFLETLMVVIINITETKYQTPKPDSKAWQTFSASPFLNFDAFLSFNTDSVVSGSDVAPVGMAPNNLVIPSIMSRKHCWCSVESINYHIWVKKGLQDQECAISTWMQHPRIIMHVGKGMEDVNVLLNRGLAMIKGSLIEMCKAISPPLGSAEPLVNIASLEAASISFLLFWDNLIDSFKVAVDMTAHQQYIGWFRKSFRPGKHRLDHTYKPNDNGSPSRGTTSSHYTRPRI